VKKAKTTIQIKDLAKNVLKICSGFLAGKKTFKNL